MCRKCSEAQGTGRGSEKGARDAGKYLRYFGFSDAGRRRGIMNSTEGIIS